MIAATVCLPGAARSSPQPALPPSAAWVQISTDELREGYDTLWAVSDVHGRLEQLERLLVGSGLAVYGASTLAWNPSRGRQLLIVAGDLIDGGRDSVGTALLLEDLQRGAAAAGSRLVVLLGNHEVEFLARPGSAGGALLASARRPAARLGPAEEMNGEQLYASAFGRYLRTLPVAAFVGTWLFAHAGYVDAEGGAAGTRAYFARIAEAAARGECGPLLERTSILAYHDWWKSGRNRSRMRKRLRRLGLNGLVIGHDPDALRSKGAIAIDRQGWLMKLDTGMKTGAAGMLLRCEVSDIAHGGELTMAERGAAKCRAMAPDGSLHELARE